MDTIPSVTTPPGAPLSSNVAISPFVDVNWLARELPDEADQREYAQERCRVALSEAIGDAIERAGLSRVELAERLGCTKGYISQVLSGERNMTLNTLADLMWACAMEVRDLELAPLGIARVTVDEALEWSERSPDPSPAPAANSTLALAA
jgi:predicted XRE-type DNA-binding protein